RAGERLNNQPDLFGEPLLAGFAYAPSFLTVPEEAELLAHIDAETLAPFRFHGWLGKRLTTSLGWTYDFDSGQFATAPSIPEWLHPIRERAEGFAGLREGDLVQALLTRYDPGAGIGWHRDRSVFADVVGISLGAPAPIRFRRRSARGFERVSHGLLPRSIYHLSGPARHEWEHSIAPIEAPR
ncbi:MAG: alpha-ketoglutarate-dependent dioxygenase AlkB, partial [Novosphingobium sp.]